MTKGLDPAVLGALAISDQGVLILDDQAKIRHANPRAQILWQLGPEAWCGLEVSDLFDIPSSERRNHPLSLLHGALSLKTWPSDPEPLELGAKLKDGTRIPVEVRFALLEETQPPLHLLVVRDLRILKQQEERLMLLSSAVEQAPAGIMIADLEGVVEFVNDGFTHLTGIHRAEVTGRNFLGRGSVIAAFSHNPSLCSRILSSRAWQGEIRGKTRIGEEYAAMVTISPILGPRGEPVRILGRFQETTEAVRDKEALKVSEQRFSTIAQLVGEWLWEQNPEGFFTYSSEAVEGILGYRPEEVVGRHYQELMTEADRRLWSRTLPPPGRIQKPFHHLINHYSHREGREVFTESSGMPVLDESGKLLAWRGADRDISERKHQEDQIRLRERAIEAASVGIAIADAKSHDLPVLYANPALSRITGYSQDEILGQNLRFLQGAGTEDKDRDVIRKALAFGVSCEVVLRNYRKDGQPFWNELQLSPVHDETGEITHYIGVVTDVSERLKAEGARHQLSVAREIQLSLLPKKPLVLGDLVAAGMCIAASQVGGDYYDIIAHGDFVDLVVADVSGHSVGAALIMAEMRSTLKAELRRTHPSREGVADLLTVLNDLLFQDLDGADLFITMFYMRYQRSTRMLWYSNAGHNPPLLLRSGAGSCELLDTDGMILGVNPTVRFEEKNLKLEGGDRMLLYTDGAVEAQNPSGQYFGQEALCDAFMALREKHAEATLENLLDRLRDFGSDAYFVDDVTLAVFFV